MTSIIEALFDEARAAHGAKVCLSATFRFGNVLQGVLLCVAKKKPEQLNRSPASTKDAQGKVRRLQEWSFEQFIEVAVMYSNGS